MTLEIVRALQQPLPDDCGPDEGLHQPSTTINDSEGDRLPGWHGGATVAESYVPIAMNIPGNALADREFLKLAIPPGSLRNWHLARILVNSHRGLNN